METTAILFNAPALHSLKRAQLIKLCKRHDIKASGKNVELVAKLMEHAKSLGVTADAFQFEGSSLANVTLSHEPDSEDEDEEMNEVGEDSDHFSAQAGPSSTVNSRLAYQSHAVRPSQQWEMVSEEVVVEETSAAREFGMKNQGTMPKSSSVSSSIKALAMSLKKAAKSSSMKSKHSAVEQAEQPDEDEVEANTSECHTTLPDTPEAERRMDRLGISVSKGESTIRLITPSSSQQLSNLSPSTVDVATLFPPLLPMKDDVSPRLAYPTPPLAPDTSMEDLAPMPGSFFQVSRSLPPPSPAFVFGSPRHSVSNNQFRSAAGAVLEEMNRRMGVDATSSAGLTLDILSAKPALPALPSNPSKPKTETGIKFDHAHKRTFDKMDSIVNHYSVRQAGSVQGRSSLAPSKRASGARRPSSTRAGPTSGKRKSSVVPRNIPTTPASISEGDDSRQVKRAKTTDEVTSINASAESVEAKPQVVFVNDHAGAKRAGQVAAARRKSRSSVGRKSVGKAAMLGDKPKPSSRFGFFKSSAKAVRSVWNAAVSSEPAKASPRPKTMPPSHVLSPSSLPVPVASAKSSTGTFSSFLSRSSKQSVGPPASSTKSKTSLAPSLLPQLGQSATSRNSSIASTSAARPRTGSTMSAATPSARATTRGSIPTFENSNSARTSGVMGPPRSTIPRPSATLASGSGASGSLNRPSSSRPSSSTLHAPTAASLARMQSNVRPSAPLFPTPRVSQSNVSPKPPPTARPLPAPPVSRLPTVPSTPQASTAREHFASPLFSAPTRDSSRLFPRPPQHNPVGATPARTPSNRRPRVSRSKVIAKLGEKRAHDGRDPALTGAAGPGSQAQKARSSLAAKAHARRSLGAGLMKSPGLTGRREREKIAEESHRRGMRKSEMARRKSKVPGGRDSASPVKQRASAFGL